MREMYCRPPAERNMATVIRLEDAVNRLYRLRWGGGPPNQVQCTYYSPNSVYVPLFQLLRSRVHAQFITQSETAVESSGGETP